MTRLGHPILSQRRFFSSQIARSKLVPKTNSWKNTAVSWQDALSWGKFIWNVLQNRFFIRDSFQELQNYNKQLAKCRTDFLRLLPFTQRVIQAQALNIHKNIFLCCSPLNSSPTHPPNVDACVLHSLIFYLVRKDSLGALQLNSGDLTLSFPKGKFKGDLITNHQHLLGSRVLIAKGFLT